MPRCRIFFTMNLAVPLAWVGLEQAVGETLKVVSTGEAKLLVLPDPGTPNFAQIDEIDERTRKGGASP